MVRSRSIASRSKTLLRYLATKTKCTCILKAQCRPVRISLSLLIDQQYDGAMQRLQAFRYELRPSGEQERNMRRFAGSCRFVFNKALALQQARHEQGEKKLGYAGLCKLGSPAGAMRPRRLG